MQVSFNIIYIVTSKFIIRTQIAYQHVPKAIAIKYYAYML